MQIETNSVVTLGYTLRDDQGEVLDSSQGEEPLTYIHGTGALIPGLEKALQGKGGGEKLKVTVSPEEAYGARDPSLVMTLPKEQFEDPDGLEEGMRFEAETPQGDVVFTVVDIHEGEVTLDGNHPLAGMTLHFEVEVMDVREATPEELAGGCGCQEERDGHGGCGGGCGCG